MFGIHGSDPDRTFRSPDRNETVSHPPCNSGGHDSWRIVCHVSLPSIYTLWDSMAVWIIKWVLQVCKTQSMMCISTMVCFKTDRMDIRTSIATFTSGEEQVHTDGIHTVVVVVRHSLELYETMFLVECPGTGVVRAYLQCYIPYPFHTGLPDQ